MKIEKLESIRGFAAIYVVIHHFIGFSFIKDSISPIVRFPFRFGQEAVILFFLLSGFVIYLSVYNKNNLTFKDYFLKRLIRIYPILIFSFILSVFISKSYNHVFSTNDLKQLIGNFFMLQDIDNKPGIQILPFLKNDPLWSLSYEWWFYMIFFPLYFLRRKLNSSKFIYLILTISAASWILYIYNPGHAFLILSYFIIWWSGLECADIYIRDKDFTFSNLLPVLSSLFIMLCFSIIPILIEYFRGVHHFSQIKYPVITFRHYLFSFLTIFIGLLWWKFDLAFFNKIFAPFSKLSKISYAVYIIHFPFLWLRIPYIYNTYFELVVKIGLIFILSYILEIKVQPLLTKFFFKKQPKLDDLTPQLNSVVTKE